MNRLGLAVLVLATLCFGPSVQAGPITFDLLYSGSGNGNSAIAAGTVTFDDTILPNPGGDIINVNAAALGILDFSITVSGASSGNGTFGMSSVTNWFWNTTAPLDFQQELVGQAGFGGFGWCALLFDGCTAPAPGSTNYFTLQANAETGDVMQLVSMTASVPEPSTGALLGLILVAYVARKRVLRKLA